MFALAGLLCAPLVAQRQPATPALPRLSESDVRQWLTTLSSDAMQGRHAFSEGYGLAASYVASELARLGAKPLGDDGTYFQTVRRHGYRSNRRSSITVRINGQERVFVHGDHVSFAANSGSPQALHFDALEFAGYGLVAERREHRYNDFADRDLRGRLVVWLPGTPASLGRAGGRGPDALVTPGNRSSFIVSNFHGAAVLTFNAATAVSPAEAALARAQTALQEATAAVRNQTSPGRGAAAATTANVLAPSDFTSTQRIDRPTAPVITGDAEFFRFLFAGAPRPFDELRAMAEQGDPLPSFAMPVSIDIQIDNDYELVSTELSKNVVAIVEGRDPVLRDSYVLYGAHLDHLGYRYAPARPGDPPDPNRDVIYNGADDDGSGSSALLAIAKALAAGPQPKRSVVFVWHTNEENGLGGSRFMAEHPIVPLDKVQAQINIDMIGRNRHDDPAQSNTVFIVGADRISTDLHNLLVATNGRLRDPLTLDFAFNDPADANSFYTRSDHFSYALRGVPVAFFFTGTHPDYHQVTDHVDKILFPKLMRVAQLAYELGFAAADRPGALRRDNLGPRAGRGFQGPIE